ncbi:MAG TPA: helix-turn-helix domain-containing protein [Zoogloea sp.]|uniref:winged helix-turn-helix transcriptional regulator n=1 Tax=Zoogloea sp. TaxID=49181 RepID=UPI002C0A1007|nr:helix-turn-helix domain-containing protein [Zoogloea sp.]HMV18913.1 helix-turn-helix domain-containing protein [Rhodocyclaceae bacterium]HMV63400.1 helix-turn-helix domain-containing protein [Rhodocyclaceae bacterium]HMW50546.1 helix-turn-helix domain-containing protein [Rhodocyclaceae bacterium]HMY49819.1 helix-turn-helix domain-containing protein [Rhodocyclaceae bacterium]HMZ75665.1 helix-turn-helix domain-containing protein [Rhodocyclaceae bacterium]
MKREHAEPVPQPPEGCPLERYLHVVSGAWVPRILWFLSFGPRRFGELRRDIGNISAKVLTAKLRDLEGAGLVARTETRGQTRQVAYALTERGRIFEPVFDAMVEVSHRLAELEAREAASKD